LGGEDLDKYQGSPFLIRAKGDENFDTKSGGEIVIEHPSPGEAVWCDDGGVVSDTVRAAYERDIY
jgi:DNA/RNA-binding domain of Phe-tRNA-synthetase-like protein